MDAASLIMALAVLAGLYMAWNIGANDVANAMGTSVGSGALTLRHALIIAIIFESLGALFSGGRVTETISQGLVDLSSLPGDALLLTAGMTCCLIAGAVWLNFASFMGWPVSTTHCIVGALLGFGLVLGGPEALDMQQLAVVGLAWVIFPIIAMWAAYQSFAFIRRRILGVADPLVRIQRYGPILAGGIVSLLSMGVLFRGDSHMGVDLTLLSAAVISAAVGLVTAVLSRPIFARSVEDAPPALDERVRRAERVFKRLQVFAACYLAFAHGSNDIANAVGPLAVVFHGLQSGFSVSVAVPPAVILVGVVGVAIGLVSYGAKVMATVGKDITDLTASSGCAAVFAGATVILFGSKLGLPVSTTHIMVGAVIGVGFARGIAAINTRVLRVILASWIVTVPITALISAILVAGARSWLG